MAEVTVGVDIGTTSVKAVAVDAEGTVKARTRVPHELVVPAPDRFEHRPAEAWRDGVRQALREVADGLDVAAVDVAAMVPSLCAVDDRGHPLTPGLLYGDARGRGGGAADPSQSGELLAFLAWCSAEADGATAFWPAQAMANHALGGEAVLDTITAMTTVPLFDYEQWDGDVAAASGATVDQLPRIVPGDQPAGRVSDDVLPGGALLGPGTVDAFAEQLVSGAVHDGDVLVICGTTLIVWAVVPEWREAPGLWTVPHSVPGKSLVGGASNAGGLFLDWARRLLGTDQPGGDVGADPGRVPVWTPYLRGERTPLHDPDRRGGLHDLDLTHRPGDVGRAAFEAAGFVIRHHLELAGLSPQRIVATGGGVRVEPWVQAMADATALPVDVVAVPEGAALGAAFMARVVAGLEESAEGAGRWAATGRRVEPDAAWVDPCAERYRRFRELTGGT